MEIQTALPRSSFLTTFAQDRPNMTIGLQDSYDVLIQDISEGWGIEFDDLNGVSYDLDIGNKKIIIHNFGLKTDNLFQSPYFKPQATLSTIEALRMVRHVEWLDGALNRYHPETILLIGRICVADAQIHKIKCAWDAKMNDDHSLWKHILCGEESDMAVAFIHAFEKFLSSGLDEEEALKKSMAVAFNTWFSSADRQRDCDHDTLNLIDSMIAENTQFEGKRLEKNAITCLTLLAGYDTTYIDKYLQEDVLRNPYYSSVCDEINQSHLMQIISDMNKIHVGGLVFQDATLAARFTVCE